MYIIINKNKYNNCDFILLDQYVPANQTFLIFAVIFKNIERKKKCVSYYI